MNEDIIDDMFFDKMNEDIIDDMFDEAEETFDKVDALRKKRALEKQEDIIDTIETAPDEFEPGEIQAIERKLSDIENTRVMTFMAALVVKSRFPDLTVIEVFEKMEDVEFVKMIIRDVVEEEREDIS